MMDERRRFQLALAGIGVCLAIAGLFVVSGPPLIPPPVASPSDPGIAARTPVALPASEALRRLESPLVAAPAAPTARTHTLAAAPTVQPPLAGVIDLPTAPDAGRTTAAPPAPVTVLPAHPPVVLTASAPEVRAPSMTPMPAVPAPGAPLAQGAGGRGAMTGAFVAAGKEVGRGFRTAGRAIRAIF